MLTPVIGIAARDHTVADQDPRRVKETARPCRNTGDTSTWRAASAPLTRYTQLPASCVLTPAGPDRWDVHNGCTHPHGPRSSPQERFAPAEDMPCTGRYPLSGVTAPVTRRQRVERSTVRPRPSSGAARATCSGSANSSFASRTYRSRYCPSQPAVLKVPPFIESIRWIRHSRRAPRRAGWRWR